MGQLRLKTVDVLPPWVCDSAQSTPSAGSFDADARLVRCRGMVQDVGPTQYLRGAGDETWLEQTPVVLVPVPGEGERERRLVDRDRQAETVANGHALTNGASAASRALPEVMACFPGTDDWARSLNDIVEVVGVLSSPTAEPDEHATETDGLVEVWARLPCIHVRHWRVCVRHGTHAAWTAPVDASESDEDASPSSDAYAFLVHKALAPMLSQNDPLLAHYLLLTLLSSSASPPASRCSLHLSLPPSTPRTAARHTAHCLTQGLQALVPRCVALEVSVAALNAREWTPRKDYGTNRLEWAPLQLPRGTLLVLDETTLEEDGGKLNEIGVRNVRALLEMVRDQTVRYQYDYTSGVRVEVDIPVMLITCGRGLLASSQNAPSVADVRLPLPPLPPDQALEVPVDARCRAVLARLQRAPWPRIDDAMAQRIEHDYVQERRDHPDTCEPDTLQRWLRLASLEARAHREEALTLERWTQMRAREAARLERVRDERGG